MMIKWGNLQLILQRILINLILKKWIMSRLKWLGEGSNGLKL